MIPCNWQLILCGVNHKTAAVDQREPLQIGREDLARANAILVDLEGIKESAIVSTCNRIEFYLITDNYLKPLETIAAFYREFNGADIAPLENIFYIRREKHAVDHIFRVSAGIDSMVIGENQILSQLKEAYTSACAVKSAGKVLHRLFHQAFRIGKQVRSDTELGKGACSISTAMIELIKEKVDADSDPTVLFIGLNQMISLATARMKRRGYTRFLFANRTESKAVEFASEHKAQGYGLDKLPDLLPQTDIVISCTGSTEPIITDTLLRNALSDQPDRNILIADMAIPRDVELKETYAGIRRYDLDDIEDFVKSRQTAREDAIPDAEEIITGKLDQFMYWFDHVRHEPMYNGIGVAFEKIRQDELKQIFETLPDDSRRAVDIATRRMIDKLLQMQARSTAAHT